MLLLFTHKSHTGPPLRYIPMIVCKGTKKQAQYKTKCENMQLSFDLYKNMGIFISCTQNFI